jgi:Zn finger protein HypA/HybF involved in hydrogenase expression
MLSLEDVMMAVEEDSCTGFCLNCGAEGVAEPDARKYTCDECGEKKLFGAEEILLMGIGNIE